MHFLIDADSAIYKAGCANEHREYLVLDSEERIIASFPYKKEVDAYTKQHQDKGLTVQKHKESGPIAHALANVRSIIDRIISKDDCDSYTVYVGGNGNFRYDLFAEYKSNRDSSGKPLQYQEIKDYLVKRYNGVLVDGEEVDDRVSIEQCEAIHSQTHGRSDVHHTDTCIVSVDKDLDNTPGWHYNYDKEKMYYITPEEGYMHFYKQMLTGDSTDGIPGLPRVGPKTADRILDKFKGSSAEELCSIVWKEYKKKGFDLDYFILQGRLLHMRTLEDELWEPPVELK